MSIGVSMDPSAKYPSMNVDRLLRRKVLSDRKIAFYQKHGWYSSDVREMRRDRNAQRMARRAAREGNFQQVNGRLIFRPL